MTTIQATFGGVQVQFIVRKDNTLTATVPGGTRTGEIGVPRPGATVRSRPRFLMVRPALRAPVGPRLVKLSVRPGD